LRAEGEKQAAILRAEGDRQAQFLLQQGRAAGLQALQEHARDIDPNTMMLQYLDSLRALGASPSTKYVVPVELVSLLGRFMATLSTNGVLAEAPAQPESSNGNPPREG
jgi:regulator of protease activity HflC (stomatin/prohibitin superfamily)